MKTHEHCYIVAGASSYLHEVLDLKLMASSPVHIAIHLSIGNRGQRFRGVDCISVTTSIAIVLLAMSSERMPSAVSNSLGSGFGRASPHSDDVAVVCTTPKQRQQTGGVLITSQPENCGEMKG